MLRLFKVNMSPKAPDAAAAVLRSGYVGQGRIVDEFEDELKRVLGTEMVPITTNSCTSAITLALMLLGVGPGDEVITTPVTCTATNSPVVLAGARPVWADVDPVTGNLDPIDVGRKVTQRTRAIIAVDWSGRACDYAAIRAAAPGIPIIEDAAHGPITRFGGDFVCLSFGPIKHLCAGDGGALVIRSGFYLNTDHAQLADTNGRLLRWYGLDRTNKKSFRCEQDIQRVGGKFHMNDINAAIGLANLSRLKFTVSLHRATALILDTLIEPTDHVQKPPVDQTSCWWVYTLRVDDRVSFEQHMSKWGVETSQVHARNDLHHGFSYPNGPLPGVDLFDSIQISVPCGWWLTQVDVEHIVKAVNTWNR